MATIVLCCLQQTLCCTILTGREDEGEREEGREEGRRTEEEEEREEGREEGGWL